MSEEQLKAHEERIREIVDIAVLLAPEPPQDGQETYTAKQMRIAVHEALLIPKPTPPASEPSEQPNAEDAEAITAITKGIRDMFWSAWRDGCDSAHDTFTRTQVDKMCDHYIEDRFEAVETLVQSYACHTAAKAVEAIGPYLTADQAQVHFDQGVERGKAAERQRLARLVEERVATLTQAIENAPMNERYISFLAERRKEARDVHSWLAGEGEKR